MATAIDVTTICYYAVVFLAGIWVHRQGLLDTILGPKGVSSPNPAPLPTPGLPALPGRAGAILSTVVTDIQALLAHKQQIEDVLKVLGASVPLAQAPASPAPQPTSPAK